MSSPLHVLHVNFAKGFRGGERQTLSLMQGLHSHGVSQSLVCRSNCELAPRGVEAGLKVYPVRHPLLGHAGVPPATLIHVHEARGGYWAGIEAVLRKTPYLITRRISHPVSSGIATRLLYRHAAAVIGVSAYVSKQLQRQIGRQPGVILDGCLPLSVDDHQLSSIKLRCGSGPVIGHIGALQDSDKGQSVLIAAFQKLVLMYPDARLVLVGDGPDSLRLKQQANGDSRIIFAGFQNDVGAWLAAMDLFVFPSRKEGLGSSVLDAMLLAIPVIASDVGGLPELIGKQERGWLVSGHDPEVWCRAINEVLLDTTQKKQRIAAAKAFSKGNSVASMATDYLNIYREIQDSRAASI